jgi:hypothetical protein
MNAKLDRQEQCVAAVTLLMPVAELATTELARMGHMLVAFTELAD